MISFRKGLSALGFVDGENVIIEYAWAEGHFERPPQLAANLIQRGVSVDYLWGALDSERTRGITEQLRQQVPDVIAIKAAEVCVKSSRRLRECRSYSSR